MYKRILTFFIIFFYFVLIFLLGKLIFMGFHFNLYKDAGFSNWVNIWWNGLSMDFSMSGYFTAIPAILLLLSIWLKKKIISTCFTIYFVIISVFISIIFIVDTVLYTYWGFHLDTTVFFYLENIKGVFASTTILEVALGILGIATCFSLIMIGYRFFIFSQINKFTIPKSRWITSVVLLLMTGILFIPICGGVTVSTMNIRRAYFSTNPYYNQAAVNSCFNFLYSLSKSEDYSSQFHYMDDSEAVTIFETLTDKTATDSIPQLLNTQRPNVILFVLESFGAIIAEPLGGIKDVAPNLTKFCNEGILFSNIYANSFRTDRGLVSILSGYPAQALTSIMKYPQKTQNLPAIPKTLGKNGYSRELLYGGDIDFTNMRSYFFGCCTFEKITSDVDFPLKDRMTKWGAPDHILMDTLVKRLQKPDLSQPFFKMALTLSSHEPFEVPFHKFDNPYLNSVAYTDSCLGYFVDEFKKTPYWNNTVIIMVADHATNYPEYEASNPKRYHIPIIWTGGAIKKPEVINQIGSQMDLAATLFGQMNIKHDDFTFSKNMLNPSSPHFAFYSYVNGFAFINSTGTIVYDNNAKKALIQDSSKSDSLIRKGKAYLQYSYMDFEKR